MILRLPADLSKSGFEHSWTFDQGYSVKLAKRLYENASNKIAYNIIHSDNDLDFKYGGLYDYFDSISKTLNLGGYKDRFGCQRKYSLKFLRRKKTEQEFIKRI